MLAKVFRITALLSVTFLLACGGDAPQQAGPQQAGGNGGPGQKRPAPKPVPIAVAAVEIGEALSFYTTTSTLEPEAQASVLARTTGVIKEILYEEGAVVEQGDLLLRLEDDAQKLNLKQAVINRDATKVTFDRNKKMYKQGVLSPTDYEAAENAWQQAVASVEQRELELSYTEIRAPFTGAVTRRHLDVGAHVNNGVALFEMMDVTPLLARVYIPANRMGGIKMGQDLRLVLDSTGETLDGMLRLISPIVDANTGTVKVTAEINNYPIGTRPGDFAEVSIVTDRHDNARLVASEAVFEEQGRNILYVAKDGKADRREVEVGFVEQGKTEILTGIEAGELVIIKGQRNLRPGMPVEILEGPASSIARSGAPRVEAAP